MEYQYFSISLHKISNTKNNDYDRLLCTKPLVGLAAHQPPVPAARTDQWRLLYCLLCSRRPLCVYFISLYRQSDDSDHCLCDHHLAEHFLPQAGGPTLVSQSNVDALIGRIGRVTEAIEANGYGRVQIDGDSWKAKTRDGHPVENGMKARVLSIDSIIITVEEA